MSGDSASAANPARQAYWRAYYANNKARIAKRNTAYKRTYRPANKEAIKVAQALGVPIGEARRLLEPGSRQ